MSDLRDKVAVITGASSGIGRATAEAFAAKGASNIVCPGIIVTPMHQRLRGLIGDEIYDNVLQQRVHTRRAGRAEEIAGTVVFLCSDEASYITGSTLTPDGGFTLTI